MAPTYDVAISFAGEDRSVADSVAAALVTRGINVFYDEYERANLWGKDLYSHLTTVYRDDSKYCLMLLSASYAEKQWTNHERRAAQARAFRENAEYILPLRLDDTPVDGVLDTTGYVDFRTTPLNELVELLAAKVAAYNQTHGIPAELVRVQDVFARAGSKASSGPEYSDSDFITQCPTCGTRQSLAEAPLTLDGASTVYTCREGCQPVVIVSRPGLVAWPGRGYRLGDHVVRNAADVYLARPGAKAVVQIPASKAALKRSARAV